MRVQNDILVAMDKGYLTALILLDLSAAFDTVDHNTLLSRLHSHIGISGNALKWCNSYLKGRPQYVRIGSSSSNSVIHDFSVPQGSVLGPQWFTIYTYPIRDIILRYNLRYHVYADDTQLYVSFRPDQDQAEVSIDNLKSCISEIHRWMQENFLQLNADKTEFMLFGSKQQLSKVSLPFITISESDIAPNTVARNLGVVFDSNMTLVSHVSNIVKSASYHLCNIRKIRKYLNPHSTQQIIHAFVTSRLDMGNSLLYGLPQNQLKRLQNIQNAAARIVTLSSKSTHITPILKELHWLPVRERIIYKLMLLVFKSLNKMSPSYISELLQPYKPSRNLRSSTKFLLDVPRSFNSWGDRAFSIAAPQLWNTLPHYIRTCNSVKKFKSLLKTYLMTQAFP